MNQHHRYYTVNARCNRRFKAAAILASTVETTEAIKAAATVAEIVAATITINIKTAILHGADIVHIT